MDYKEFKEKILEDLRDFYGDNVEVELKKVQKNNGICHDGVQIRMKGDSSRVTPVIRLDELYSAFSEGVLDMEDCVQVVSENLKDRDILKSIEQFAEKLKDWSFVKEKVFPILLSTEDNRELLHKLASTQMLDLSVAYIIRVSIPDDCDGGVKVTQMMLQAYGISIEQLHAQALENLRKDGYEFQDMDDLIRGMLEPEEAEEMCEYMRGEEKMYVLTNSRRTYGAAGILDRELLKRFAGEQDYVILPSSLHETIFVPVDGEYDKEAFDSMVEAVNQKEVSLEERLISHSYYYDARAGEIKMCA